MSAENRVVKFGIAVDNMGRNDLTLLILSNLNKYMGADPALSPSIFFREMAPALGVIPCPLLSFNDLWCFTYDVMATSYDTAKALLEVPGPRTLYYYVHELPTPRNDDYFGVRDTLSNDRLNILCRSDLHKVILENNYIREGKEIRVVDENSLLGTILGLNKEKTTV